MDKIRITISRFIKLKDDLKKFRKKSLGKKDKLKICKTHNVTSDDINCVIKHLAYEYMRVKLIKLK